MNLQNVLVLFLSFICLGMQAQTGKVRGFVNNKVDDAPIPFANAVLEGTDYGAVANDQGFFIINDVPPGEYTLQVSFVGFDQKAQKVVVKAGRIESVKMYLAESSEVLESVEVNAERQERDTKVLTGVVSLSPKKIQQFSVGGDPDIIKAIQVIPGVVTTGDQGGQLFIRGGAPIQNLVLMDGMVLYNPFHSIGFFSVFDADIIESADIYSGGFGAEYGSRNSAVMDIRTRDPNRKRLAGSVYASTYSAKLLLETPLGEKDKNGRSASSVMVSAKTSYLDQTSQFVYPYIDNEYDGLPFTFTDIYGKFNAQSDNGSEVNVFGFSFNDGVKFGGDSEINWDAAGAGVDFTAVPPASSVLLSGGFSWSKYDIASQLSGSVNPNSSGVQGFNAGLDFTYFLSDNDELKYGIEAIGYQTNLELFDDFGNRITNTNNTTELGAYFQYKIATDRWLIKPGLRAQYYSSQSELSLEPRLGIKYNINSWLRAKASAGLYSQNLTAANSDRDVVNLFYGFLSGITLSELNSDPNNPEYESSLQKAQHVITGIEIEATENISINVEGYVKNFSQIINVNRDRISSEDPQYVVERGWPAVLIYWVNINLANGISGWRIH
ncbi:MAG: carboxypeptidase-like regulatory domain-containing protein [Owenweeksia sp.]|nr:carboxypeptidase-like regulatory domain-containing protein [Owenweeksia sp.]